EQWYATHALNHERDPIGSRDCGLQWAAWQAGSESHRAELAACREDADRYRHVRKNPAMLLHLSNKDFDDAVDKSRKGEGE
ncbi:MAG: hypothetical protein KA154_14720, partial [Gemmatimonadaceae bacterium]|nr:hypothetical protein [Gemmatimonadaceae bacterium]